MKRPAARKLSTHGEDALQDVASISLRLENGREVSFNIASETGIPDDLNEVVRLANKAPARFSFWSYQAERALYAVRRLEIQLFKLEGEANENCRAALGNEGDGSFIAEGSVQAMVDHVAEVVEMREQLASLRLHYGLIKSVRDAVEHRVFTIRKLVDRYGQPSRE